MQLLDLLVLIAETTHSWMCICFYFSVQPRFIVNIFLINQGWVLKLWWLLTYKLLYRSSANGSTNFLLFQVIPCRFKVMYWCRLCLGNRKHKRLYLYRIMWYLHRVIWTCLLQTWWLIWRPEPSKMMLFGWVAELYSDRQTLTRIFPSVRMFNNKPFIAFTRTPASVAVITASYWTLCELLAICYAICRFVNVDTQKAMWCSHIIVWLYG